MSKLSEICDLIMSNSNDTLRERIIQCPEIADGKTEDGISFLQFAVYCRNQNAIDILLEYRKRVDLFEAVSLGRIETVEKHLVDNPEAIGSFAIDGFTPLGLASFFGHAEMVRFLLARGADPNISANNQFKVTPLHSACAISNFEIAEELLKNGADVNARQMSGVVPLHSAAHNGQSDLAKLLISYGADVTAETEDRKTAMSFAEEAKSKEVVEILKPLILAGPDLDGNRTLQLE